MQIPDEIEKIMKDKNLVHFEGFLKKKDKYILDENKNVIPASLMEWGAYLEENHEDKIVRKDMINGLCVSTVFIGLDHKFSTPEEKESPDYKPDIFETMVFDPERNDIYCDRYATWQEAEEGHKKAMAWVIDGCVYDE